MACKITHAVTGAFGYSGRYIAKRLLERGYHVRTLTGSPNRHNPFGAAVEVMPFAWDAPDQLVQALAGVGTLFNTYWVRFNAKRFCFAAAVENSRRLFAAAQAAGVRRIVHISITNPDVNSGLEYFRGKAQVEAALAGTRISHAILRPALIFGREDILLNNIAWGLRHLPLFPLFGDGEYKLQPIYVDDLAEIAVQCLAQDGNHILNAVGPEAFTFRELVTAVGKAIGHPRMVVPVSPLVAHGLAWALGKCLRDVIITRDEIRGLMDGRLYVDTTPTGHTALTQWATENRQWLGRRYSSELARRTNRQESYSELRGEER